MRPDSGDIGGNGWSVENFCRLGVARPRTIPLASLTDLRIHCFFMLCFFVLCFFILG